MLALGLDTSNYTTSAALCSSLGDIKQSRRLLPVKTGERGLRQSEAVFAHVRQLANQVENVMRMADEPLSCVCASVSPRDGADSYMPVFNVGEMVGRSIAATHHVPFYETTHQRGHIRAARVDMILYHKNGEKNGNYRKTYRISSDVDIQIGRQLRNCAHHPYCYRKAGALSSLC